MIVCAPAGAQPAVLDALEAKTLAAVRAVDDRLDGVLGMAAVDLASGRVFSYRGDTVFPQASSIKIPILIEMFRAARAGAFRMTDPVTLRPEDAVGGSGHLRARLEKGPLTLSVLELVTAMMETSDNTATNQAIRMVGMERVNRTLESMGFRQTRLRRIMMDAGAARRDEENVSTPLEMARLAERLHQGAVIDGESSREMLAIMKKVKGDFRKAVPETVETASKTGSVAGVKCETGVIYLPGRPFALSVMSAFLAGEAGPVGEVARLVYAHFEKVANSNSYGHRTGR